MALTSAPLLALWIFQVVSSSHGQEVVRAHPGQDVTLKCQAPNNVSIIVLEWSRPDLEPEYVFFYREGRSYLSYQNPSFAGRVELIDREMKNGNLSLSLKNVSRNDAGTYECRVVTGGTRRRKRANIDTEPSSTIILMVEGEFS
uniref:V-set domain-containing T-cell activation inhibitor 1-like n=1 Tax=Centroberyx gerrardi TaxID=166262 RepID=UPI003AAC1980